MKVCTVCKESKDLNLFYNRTISTDGKAYRCKECEHKAITTYKLNHPEKFKKKSRKARLKHIYNISLEDYDKLLQEQNGVCYICQEISKDTLAVDHCHTSGVIRGLLCGKCNKALGLFKDSTEFLKRAIKYLELYNNGR